MAAVEQEEAAREVEEPAGPAGPHTTHLSSLTTLTTAKKLAARRKRELMEARRQMLEHALTVTFIITIKLYKSWYKYACMSKYYST